MPGGAQEHEGEEGFTSQPKVVPFAVHLRNPCSRARLIQYGAGWGSAAQLSL